MVDNQNMSQSQADRRIKVTRAVLQTLKDCQKRVPS
jgi:predicted DNA-binding protein (UPF0251 family)